MTIRSSNIARKIEPVSAPMLVTVEAHVAVAQGDGVFLVQVGTEIFEARRALGCLVDPREGDEVLVSRSSDHAWVLTVLSRADHAPVEIVADGDLRIRLNDGRLAVVTRDGVDVVTEGGVRVVTQEATVRARSATLLVDAATVIGATFEVEVQKVRTVAERCDSSVRCALRKNSIASVQARWTGRHVQTCRSTRTRRW
jgi:hypothetical protein